MPLGRGGCLIGGGVGRHRLERDDDRHADIQEQAHPTEEDRQEEEYPDEGGVEVEELGQTPGHAGQTTIMPATIETAVHAHPPIGSISTAPKFALTRRSARCVAEA